MTEYIKETPYQNLTVKCTPLKSQHPGKILSVHYFQGLYFFTKTQKIDRGYNARVTAQERRAKLYCDRISQLTLEYLVQQPLSK